MRTPSRTGCVCSLLTSPALVLVPSRPLTDSASPSPTPSQEPVLPHSPHRGRLPSAQGGVVPAPGPGHFPADELAQATQALPPRRPGSFLSAGFPDPTWPVSPPRSSAPPRLPASSGGRPDRLCVQARTLNSTLMDKRFHCYSASHPSQTCAQPHY